MKINFWWSSSGQANQEKLNDFRDVMHDYRWTQMIKYRSDRVTDLMRIGISRATAHRYAKQMEEGNFPNPGPSSLGRPITISREIFEAMEKVVLRKSPIAFGYEKPKWTSGLIQKEILRRFNIKVSIATIGRQWSAAKISEFRRK